MRIRLILPKVLSLKQVPKVEVTETIDAWGRKVTVWKHIESGHTLAYREGDLRIREGVNEELARRACDKRSYRMKVMKEVVMTMCCAKGFWDEAEKRCTPGYFTVVGWAHPIEKKEELVRRLEDSSLVYDRRASYEVLEKAKV